MSAFESAALSRVELAYRKSNASNLIQIASLMRKQGGNHSSVIHLMMERAWAETRRACVLQCSLS